MKKIISLLFIVFTLNAYSVPVSAFSENGGKEVIEAAFVSDLNVNKSSAGQVVQFRTVENYTDSLGNEIPKGTIFAGEIKSFKKGRWAYRRAKVRIRLTEMRFPDGSVYSIKGNTKRKVLKGSALVNTTKGIVTLPLVLVIGAGGACVMLLECVSIFGIILLVPTGVIVAGLCGKFSNGINCKKSAGDVLKLEYYSARYKDNN